MWAGRVFQSQQLQRPLPACQRTALLLCYLMLLLSYDIVHCVQAECVECGVVLLRSFTVHCFFQAESD